jgi:hypothetical protein
MVRLANKERRKDREDVGLGNESQKKNSWSRAQ